MSTLRRTSLALLAVVLVACTEDQSRSVGSAPKQTVERAEKDVSRALEQGAARSREEK